MNVSIGSVSFRVRANEDARRLSAADLLGGRAVDTLWVVSLERLLEVAQQPLIGELLFEDALPVAQVVSLLRRGSARTSGADRRGLSAGAILEPQLTSFISVEASLNVELADDTGYDTLAIIDNWLAGTALGTIALGTEFGLQNCYMLGDGPNLQDGIQPFTIRVQPSSLVVVTTA